MRWENFTKALHDKSLGIFGYACLVILVFTLWGC
jgi:hypothetical protein